MNSAPKLGIIAGGGTAPRRLIEACRANGRDFFVICLEGHANNDLAHDAPHTWHRLGAASKLKTIFADNNIDEIIMIGHVRRPSMMEIKPDWLALKILTKIGMNSLGDDGLMRGIGKALEEETNVRVIGIHDVFTDLLAPAGCLTNTKPDAEAEADIKRGVDILQTLGSLDIGQAVVIQQGLVLGIEAIEGTDALIARCGPLRREGAGGVLVKIAKPQQDNRFDLPTIGLETLKAALNAGLRGIAVEAGRSLIIEREAVIAAADTAGVFVISLTSSGHVVET